MRTFPVLENIAEFQLWKQCNDAPIHFVPTMGGLHKGHTHLINAAKLASRDQSASVVVSVFVNPLQFGPKEDFQNYPRDIESDFDLANEAGASVIWAPTINDIFPGGPSSHFNLKVPVELNDHLCGPYRPGHFNGVASVMIRLLTIIKPQILFLGEKDWQQLIIIRRLVEDLDLPVKVRGIKTIRDPDGMACSTRNEKLSPSQRLKAVELSKQLAKAVEKNKKGDSIDTNHMKLELKKSGLTVDYLETVDPYSLKIINPKEKLCLLAGAIRCGEIRLIDHTFLMTRKPLVAIDGPAGAGKSTVTRKFAEKLKLLYLDTGAMYRAVTWLIQDQNVDIKDKVALNNMLKNLDLKLEKSPNGDQTISINGDNVTEQIRTSGVTAFVSQVATISSIREFLTKQQKSMGINGGIVAEGRDIGTSVFPDAELKIYLTASSKERALRRASDLKKRGIQVPSLEDLENQIQQRDELDSTRDISPLKKAEDAIELKTDGMNIDEVVEKLIELFQSKVPEEIWPSASY